MLREAIEALRRGERTRARDLLTRLLKTDQKNAQYWVWLSASVDSQKERLYCLQTAIQVDPQNAAAKRGLILLGALPPDDSVPPFPVNRPRLWEEKTNIPKQPEEKSIGWANPVARAFIIVGVAIVVLGLFVGGYMFWPRGAKPHLYSGYPTVLLLPTITPIPTTTPTPSFLTPTATFLGPTPLWMFLDKTYTPTPLYVDTQHPIISRIAFQSALRGLASGDYTDALVLFQQAEELEPNAPDIDYYIGEVYRAQNEFQLALEEYQKAIDKDPNFAPAFLGRALANLGLKPGAKVLNDLNAAIQLDPNFAEAYIERGKYQLSSNPSAAEADFESAVGVAPDSALAYLYLAQVQLIQGENQAALVSAQRANQIDITLIPVYLTLAQAYIATGQGKQALSVLQTYTIYEPNDPGAYLAIGTAYNAAGEYQLAVNILTEAIDADQHNAEAYIQRATAYMGMHNANLAVTDFKSAVLYNPSDFGAQLGLGRALDTEQKPGDAYVQVQNNAYPLAKTDSDKAQVYYWEGTFLEELNKKADALDSWNLLISLPTNAMPADWRTQAFQYLNITPTPTLYPTLIPTWAPTSNSTITFISTITPAPTTTLTSTPTPTE